MRKLAALLVATAFAGTTMFAFAADEAKTADKPVAKKEHKKAKKDMPAAAPAAAPAAEKK